MACVCKEKTSQQNWHINICAVLWMHACDWDGDVRIERENKKKSGVCLDGACGCFRCDRMKR